MKKILSLVLVASMIAPGCATTSQNSVSFFDEEQVVGDKIHRQILSSFEVYTEPQLVAYIRDIGDTLSRYAERPLNYRFTVLFNDKIYATSAPGGYVYVTTGLLQYMENEAQVAAVMAHEIARLQSWEFQAKKGRKVLSAVLQGTALVAPLFGPVGPLVALGALMTDRVTQQPQGSNPEKVLIQADRKAMAYMVAAGYDPQGYLDVMEMVFQANGDLIPYLEEYLQSHPVGPARVAETRHFFYDLDLSGRQLLTNHRIFQEATRGIHQMAPV